MAQPANPGPADTPQPLNVIFAVHGDGDPAVPFCHALKLAVVSKGELEIVDVGGGSDRDPETPRVRTFLERWKLLPPGSAREAVERIGLRVKRIVKKGNEKKEIGRRLSRSPHDLLVIGMRAKSGVQALFGRDLSEYLAEYYRQTTLYVPTGAKPFVDPDTGAVSLNRILVPSDADPLPGMSLAMVRRLMTLFPECRPKVTGLHIGMRFPPVSDDLKEGLDWNEVVMEHSHGNLGKVIAQAALERNSDLIIMATNGRNTLAQMVLGSVTELVLAYARCPVLAIAV